MRKSELRSLPTVRVNGAFRGQRVTGQQRYAAEIIAALEELPDVKVDELRSPQFVQRSRILSWAWVQMLAIAAPGHQVLLTLTSRGPLIALNHVVAVHDLFVLQHPEWYTRRYVMTHAPILKMQIRFARLVIAVSEPVAQQVRLLSRNRVPVLVVPNAPAAIFTTAPVASVTSAVLERLGLSDGKFVLAVASHDPRKNLGRLLAAYSSLDANTKREFPLVLVGGNDDVVFVQDGGMDMSAAIMTGYLSDVELSAMYRTAKCVVFPSLDEGFGLPAVEALASEAQLIVSDIPTLRWVCGDLATYADPSSASSIASALNSLLGSNDVAQGDGARQAAAIAITGRFSWDSSATVLRDALVK